MGEHAEDAEDLTLETFANAVNLAASFDGRSSVFAWLCGIAKVRLIDHHRRHSRGKRTAPNGTVGLDELSPGEEVARFGSGSFEEILDRITARELVDAALAQLNPDEREALTLFYVEEFSMREIAAQMGRTEKAVGSLLSRAKAKPRDFLLRLMADEEARHA